MKKRILSIVLSIVMLVSLLPTTALAADTRVMVGGVDMYSAGGATYYVNGATEAVTGTEPANWNAKFDPTTSTLTIKNLSVTGTAASNYAGILSTVNLNIVLEGGNSVTGGDPGTDNVIINAGIYASNKDLTITGSGTLSATGGTATGTSGSIGIFCGNLTLADDDIVINAAGGSTESGSNFGSYGIYAGDMNISAGVVNATGGTATGGASGGIYANTVEISGGVVNATGGTAGTSNYSVGIDCGGTLSIGGNATVNATGGSAGDTCGIYSKYVTVTGGVTVATGGTASGTSSGIYRISGANVTATGGVLVARAGSGTTAKAINGTLTTNGTQIAGQVVGGAFKESSVAYDEDAAAVVLVPNDYTVQNTPITGTNHTIDTNTAVVTPGTSSNGVPLNLTEEGSTITLNGDLVLINLLGEWVTPAFSFSGSSASPAKVTGSGTLTAIGAAKSDGNSYGISASGNSYLTVDGVDVIAIGGTASNKSYGIGAAANVTVSNGGSVVAIGGTASNKSYGIGSYNLSVSDTGNITAIGGAVRDSAFSYGIDTYKASISDTAEVSAMGGAGGSMSASYGVGCSNAVSTDSITVAGGTLNAVAGKTDGDSYGINNAAGTVEIGKNSTGGTVTAVGGAAASFSSGVRGGTVTVGSGALNAVGGITNHTSYGIELKIALKVSGGTVDAAGVDYGIDGQYGQGVTISGGTVTAVGGSVGLISSSSGSLAGGSFTGGEMAVFCQNGVNALLASGYGYFAGETQLSGDATTVGSANQTVTVKEIPIPHSHPICGDSTCTDATHTLSDAWEPINSAAELTTMESGKNYYLANDITVNSTVTISGTVNLCLNGHKVSAEGGYFDVSGTLNLCSCVAGGSIKRTTTTNALISADAGATANLYNVTLDGGAVWSGAEDIVLERGTTNSGISSSAPLIDAGGETTVGGFVVLMNCKLRNNVCSEAGEGGAITVGKQGSLTATKTNVYNNAKTKGQAGAIKAYIGATVMLTECELYGNEAVTHGGAIQIWGGYSPGNIVHMTMTDCTVRNNKAGGVGGGIAVSNYSQFIMNGGSIIENATTDSQKHGGGVGFADANTTMSISGNAIISGNSANNLYIGTYSCNKLTVGTMGDSAAIGVTMAAKTGTFTTGGATYVNKFVSDNAAYEVKVDGNNLKLALPTLTDVSAEGFTGTYDGQPHGITVTAPSDATVKYGITEGEYTADPSPTYTDAGSYTVYYRVTKDGFEPVIGSAVVSISKINPSYELPTGITATYGQTLADVTLPDGWSWNVPTQSVGNVGTKSFDATFTPANTTNYNTVEAEVSVTVNAKQLTNPTLTLDVSSFTYDGSAKTPTVIVKDGENTLISGVDYDITWPADCASVGTKTVTVTFKGNYSGSAEKSFTISKANQEGFAITGEPTGDIAYGDSFTLSTTGGNGDGAVSWAVTTGSQYAEIDESGKVTVKGVGTVTITATKAESANYNVASDAYTFTSVKATPTYPMPANLTATYGQTLANVSLPNGWSWVNDSQSVGAVGTKSFDATFTPSDTVNYKTVEVKLTVTVGKATPVVAAPTAQNSVTYGAKLNTVGLTNGWTWVDGNTVPIVQNSGYVAYYTPADTDNFDWTGIYGWSTTNNRVERKVSVTVAKADASCTAPVAVDNLVYTGSAQNLVTAATPTGGTVQYSLSATGTFSDSIPTGTDAGTYTVYYKVIGDANHNGTDVLGPVQVKIAKQKVTMPTENTATFTYTGTAQTYMVTASTLYEISNETQTNAGSYTVIVALKKTANYAWADGSTDNLTFTFTIAPKAVTVTADAKTMVYGASEPALTYVATGLVAGETLNGEITRAAGNNAGTYDITQGTVTDTNNPNYTITFVGADFTITKADASCIAPVAVADLVYTGSAQTLVTAATPTGGTVQYSLSATGTFSDRIPTGTDAGTYDVYYKVIGDANHNDTAVLGPVQVTISKANQDAPVVGEVDETIFGKNDGKITGVTSAMEYRKDGTNTYTDIVGVEIAGLADGTYYVRLKGDSNHNPSSDTEVVVAAGRHLKVTFNSNGGSDINAITGLTYGTVITAPTAPTKENATFAGWFSDSACTKAWNFAKDTVTADLTLYAKWSDIPVYHISGKVLEKTGDGENDTRVVPNANVKLMLGTTVVAEQITEADGTFYFGGQIAGDYNVVVRYRAPESEHDKIVTVLVALHEHNADDIEIVLPKQVTNSIVKHEPAADGKDSVAAGTLVGGLEDVAAAVRDENRSADKVEVKLTVKDTPPVTGTPTAGTEAAKQQAQQKAIQQKAGGKQLVFFDLSLVKTINNDAPVAITDTGDTLLEIRIPFDSGNKWGITIYRYHDDKAEVLAAVNEGSTTEGFWVGDDGYIHIYTHKFSTYAVGYTVPSYGYFVPVTPDTVTSADTFDAGIVVYVTMSMLAATGSAVVIGKKRKEEN